METTSPAGQDDRMLETAMRRQAEASSHDLGLIVERLSWTPEQRLDANTRFVRFYLTLRPSGPEIHDQ
jgi:hypothetical protein